MACFAEIDGDNIVTRVITWSDTEVQKFGGPYSTQIEEHVGIRMGGTWKQTSSSGTAVRKNYAGPGFTWAAGHNGFIEPKGNWRDKWTLNTDTCQWEPPHPSPSIIETGVVWTENNISIKQGYMTDWVDDNNRWESAVYNQDGSLESEHYWNNSSLQWANK